MICKNGEKINKPNGNVLFVCQFDNAYKGKPCPFAKICVKIGDYKMIDKIDCHNFAPK